MLVKWVRHGLMVLTITGFIACAQQFDNGATLPSAQEDSFPSPQVPNGFLFRPIFKTTSGTIRAGTAFVIRLSTSERPIVVTALHLLGPAGGLPKDIAPKDVAAAVSSVGLVECFNGAFKVQIDGKPLAILDAAPLGKPSAAGDILAFWTTPDPRLATRPLASNVPNKGEPVWLAAQLVQGAPRTRRLHRGVASGIDEDGDFIFEYENAAIALRATSGAPVLNATGELVAIYLAGGRKVGQMFGIGNPVDRFRKFLESAAKSTE